MLLNDEGRAGCAEAAAEAAAAPEAAEEATVGAGDAVVPDGVEAVRRGEGSCELSLLVEESLVWVVGEEEGGAAGGLDSLVLASMVIFYFIRDLSDF